MPRLVVSRTTLPASQALLGASADMPGATPATRRIWRSSEALLALALVAATGLLTIGCGRDDAADGPPKTYEVILPDAVPGSPTTPGPGSANPFAGTAPLGDTNAGHSGVPDGHISFAPAPPLVPPTATPAMPPTDLAMPGLPASHPDIPGAVDGVTPGIPGGMVGMGATGLDGKPIPVSPATAADFAWELPTGWQALPAGGMRLITFVPPGGQPECSVLHLRGDGGGLTMNLNRWRTQLGLEPLSDADAKAKFKPLANAQAGPDAVVVEEQNAAGAFLLLAVVLPIDDGTVFLKFAGPIAVIEQQRDAFLALARSFRAKPAAPAPATP